MAEIRSGCQPPSCLCKKDRGLNAVVIRDIEAHILNRVTMDGSARDGLLHFSAYTGGHTVKKLLQNFLLKTAEHHKCRTNAGTMVRGGAGMLLIAAMFVTPGLANAGEAPQVVTAVCAGCHGADGKGVAPMFPHLAGQHSVYLKKQLNDFVDGRRKNDMMTPVVTALKSEDVNAVADYFSSQKPAGGNAGDAKLIETGMTFYQEGNSDTGVPGCVGCHMDEGAGNKIYPRLAGQSSMYISQQLANFKSGARTNDNGSLMRSVAAKMTEQEMNAVAEYLASIGK